MLPVFMIGPLSGPETFRARDAAMDKRFNLIDISACIENSNLKAPPGRTHENQK